MSTESEAFVGMVPGCGPLLAERPGTTYTSIIWGMADGDRGLERLVWETMPTHDHYNYGADKEQYSE